MIALFVTLAALSVFGPPHLKHKSKPPCPADTVWIQIKTHTDWLGGIPVETVDTTWVIKDEHGAH